MTMSAELAGRKLADYLITECEQVQPMQQHTMQVHNDGQRLSGEEHWRALQQSQQGGVRSSQLCMRLVVEVLLSKLESWGTLRPALQPIRNEPLAAQALVISAKEEMQPCAPCVDRLEVIQRSCCGEAAERGACIPSCMAGVKSAEVTELGGGCRCCNMGAAGAAEGAAGASAWPPVSAPPSRAAEAPEPA